MHRIALALQGGVDAVLLREKAMDSARLLALASELRALTREHGARLIIHSQADVADAVDADGVHVASADIAHIPDMRPWIADRASISASCHSAGELALAADHAADWAMLSPVFPTRSHPDTEPLGVEAFRHLAGSAPIPVVALGGIDAIQARELRGFPLAVIRAVLDAGDPRLAAAELAAIAGA